MTNHENEPHTAVTPSQLEKEYQLIPLGDDYEARAERAEALLNTVLPKLLAMSVVVPQSVAHDVRDLQESMQEELDHYRDDATVKANQAWESAHPLTEAYE